MSIVSHAWKPPRRTFAEREAIEALVSDRIPRDLAERLVDEFGPDREKLKAAAWVERNLPLYNNGAAR